MKEIWEHIGLKARISFLWRFPLGDVFFLFRDDSVMPDLFRPVFPIQEDPGNLPHKELEG